MDFRLQPPILGDCRFDKMFALSGSGSNYPILCGWNGGHHMYLDVADRSTTDLTFVVKKLEEDLYSCLDRFDVVAKLNKNSVSIELVYLIRFCEYFVLKIVNASKYKIIFFSFIF